MKAVDGGVRGLALILKTTTSYWMFLQSEKGDCYMNSTKFNKIICLAVFYVQYFQQSNNMYNQQHLSCAYDFLGSTVSASHVFI